MPREIKFRGKSSYDKKWIYGYLYKAKSAFDDKEKCYIRTDNILDFPVENETVGMFTGLKDKNGVEIYEGDIVQARYFEDSTSEKYVVKYDTDRAGFFPFACGDGCGCCETDVISTTYAEILGNIYDNPELIEKEGK